MSVIPCFTKISNKGLQYLHKVKCAPSEDKDGDPALFTLFCTTAENLAVTQTPLCDTLDPRSRWPRWPLPQLLPMQAFHRQPPQLQ